MTKTVRVRNPVTEPCDHSATTADVSRCLMEAVAKKIKEGGDGQFCYLPQLKQLTR